MTKAVQDPMVAVERVRDAFDAAVHRDGDLDAAMALVADDVVFTTLPVRTGARGAAALRRHLAEDVLPYPPDDLAMSRISRTGDRWRVVDESLMSFTHDRPMPWLRPGAAPTGRRVEVVAVSIVTCAGRRSPSTGRAGTMTAWRPGSGSPSGGPPRRPARRERGPRGGVARRDRGHNPSASPPSRTHQAGRPTREGAP